ncbi:unnamed protein product, partial [marine sediment metagenome]
IRVPEMKLVAMIIIGGGDSFWNVFNSRNGLFLTEI